MSVCEPSDRLMQTLRVYVPGVTDEMIELELFNMMDEFFRRTSAWRFESDIEMVEDITEYGFVDAVGHRRHPADGRDASKYPGAAVVGSWHDPDVGRHARTVAGVR